MMLPYQAAACGVVESISKHLTVLLLPKMLLVCRVLSSADVYKRNSALGLSAFIQCTSGETLCLGIYSQTSTDL